MDRFRGILMVLAAVVAFWRGWTLHAGRMALLAYGLGVVALALGMWHLTQRPNGRRRLKRGRM